MSASLIHHGHVRLINKASNYGNVYIALTIDKEIKKFKSVNPELKYKFRKEILSSFKNVYKIIPSNWHIDQNFLNKHDIDIVVQGSDYKKRKFDNKTITIKRTKNISSTLMRKIAKSNL